MSGGRSNMPYKTYLKEDTSQEPRNKRHRKHLIEPTVTPTQSDISENEGSSCALLGVERAVNPEDPPHSGLPTEPTELQETAEIDSSSCESTSDDSLSSSIQESDKLQEFFEQENVDSHLHDFTDLTVGEFMQDMMLWYKQYSVAGTCLGSVMMLFRKYLPSGNLAPSMFRILDILSILKTRKAQPETKNYCNSCFALLESTNQTLCQKCSSKEIVYSASYDVGASLKRFFEFGNLAQAIDSYSSKCAKTFAEHDTYDVVSGNICKSINTKSKYDIQLIMNFDGVPVLATKKVWPILLAIANVAPEIREDFLICAKIWQLPDKEPNVSNLLTDWVESLVALKNEGITWVCPKTEKTYKTKVSVVALIADEHTRALLQNISFSGEEFGCNYCEIASEKGGKDTRLYPFEKSQCQMRTSIKMMQQARELSNIERQQRKTLANKKCDDPTFNLIDNVKGIKGPSSLCHLPDFDTVYSLSPDYFRSFIYDVVNNHFDLISNSDLQQKEFSVCNFLKELSEKLHKIKLPTFVSEQFCKISKWEPKEALYWLLHCSLPILKDYFKDNKYLQHLCLLVEAIHILNREKISKDEISRANTLLHAFSRDCQSLYGAAFELYNIHLLLHFADTVLNLGPLWSSSSSVFIKAHKILQELLWSSRNDKNVGVGTALVNTLNTFDSDLYFKSAIKSYIRKGSGGIALLGGWESSFSSHGLAAMQEDIKLYHQACINGVVYTSEQYSKTNGTCSHFVLFQNDGDSKKEAAKILNFAKEGKNITCFAKKVRLEPAEEFFNPEFDFHVSHIYKMKETDDLVCFKIRSILKPLIAVEDYLSEPPNTFELTTGFDC